MTTYTEEQQEAIFDKVISLLKPLSSRYEPVDTAVYITATPDDAEFCDDGTPIDDGYETNKWWDGSDLCINCVDTVLYKIRMKYEGELYANPDRFPKRKIFDYRVYEAATDGHCFMCETCGKYGNFPVAADDQELDHWESDMPDENLTLLLTEGDDRMAWELRQLFIYSFDTEGEIRNRLAALAERVIKVFKP